MLSELIVELSLDTIIFLMEYPPDRPRESIVLSQHHKKLDVRTLRLVEKLNFEQSDMQEI